MPSLRPLLSPRDLGRALGVSESTVKRWVDSGTIPAERTQGGHRRIETVKAIQFIRQRGTPLREPGILGLDELVAVGALPDDAEARESTFRELLVDGDGARFRGQLLGAYLQGESVADLCDGPLRSALRHVGEMFRHDPEGILIEHRASDICLQALQQLRSLIAVPLEAPKALGCAAPEDPYLLPSIMVSVVMQSLGYRTTNLGPDTPFATLRRAVEIERPRITWLSVSVSKDRKKLIHSIRHLGAQVASLGGDLIIGGRAMERVALPDLEHVVVARSLAELAAFGRGVAAAHPGRETA